MQQIHQVKPTTLIFSSIHEIDYNFVYFCHVASNLSFADKLVKEDIDSTLEYLQMLDKQYADVKTFYDILLYQTKNGWKCAIDVALDVSEFGLT